MIYARGIDISQFPDGTPHLKENPSITMDGFVSWHYHNMGEFPIVCMLGEYIKSRGYKPVLYMPYIPNARMDRVHKGDVFTLKFFAKMLNTAGFAEIHVLDAHSDVSVGLLDNCINYQPIVAIKKAIILSEPDFIYFPDAGAMKRYESIIHKCCDKPVLHGNKIRDWSTGEIEGLEVVGGKILKTMIHPKVLMIDDICAYGGTMYYSAKALKDAGAGDIDMYVTHCEDSILDRNKGKIFTDERLIETVYTTDSILTKKNANIFTFPAEQSMIADCRI